MRPTAAGAFAYQPDKKGKLAANDDATAAASLAALGAGSCQSHWPRTAGRQDDKDKPVEPLKCAKGGGDEESGDRHRGA